MRIAILGAGLVGRRTAELLAADGQLQVVLVSHGRPVDPLPGIEVGCGWPHAAASGAEIVVLATECDHQTTIARELIRSGTHVVTTADDPRQIERLWALDDLARTHEVALVVGASYSPGVSTLLAAHMARGMQDVSTILTAQFGTGGPACARQHHRAMGASVQEVHQGRLRVSRGGSGRELVWFPEPVGAADCYRAGLADPLILQRAFPTVERIESRQAATRRDRMTARLPMLRAPHAEGVVGAVWAEVRGRVDGRVEHRAMAATAPQATGAAAMAAAFCWNLIEQQGQAAGGIAGVQSAATIEITVPFLQNMSTSVRLWTYDGSQIVRNDESAEPIHTARKWRNPRETA